MTRWLIVFRFCCCVAAYIHYIRVFIATRISRCVSFVLVCFWSAFILLTALEFIVLPRTNTVDNNTKQKTNQKTTWYGCIMILLKNQPSTLIRVQELCESRGGRPGLSALMSLTVSVDVKQHWTMLRHRSQFVSNMLPRTWSSIYIIIIIDFKESISQPLTFKSQAISQLVYQSVGRTDQTGTDLVRSAVRRSQQQLAKRWESYVSTPALHSAEER